MSTDALTPVPFVGRETELHHLQQALNAALSTRQPRFVLIQGDFGVGKTVLVEHFLAQVAADGLPVLIGRGHCALEDQDSGWVPFRQLMVSLLRGAVEHGLLAAEPPGVPTHGSDEFPLVRYNIPAIRRLLREAFTAQELWRFCQQHPAFSVLLSRFGQGASLEDMIDVVTEYCGKQALFPDLLQAVQTANPRQYSRWRDQLHATHDPSPALSSPSDAQERQRERLARWVERVAPAWLHILPGEVTGVLRETGQGIGDGHRALLAGGGYSDEQVRVQFSNVLNRLAESRPAVVLIEDLHWADVSSLNLLSSLSHHLQERPVLVIATYRPVEAMAIGENASRFREIRANLLSSRVLELNLRQGIDVAAYVEQRYPGHDLSSAFVARIEKATDGHPLFISQLFSYWQETGVLAVKSMPDGRLSCGLAEKADVAPVLPPTVGALLQERIYLLGKRLQDVLLRASVQGEEFTAQIISALLHMDELQVYEHIEDLERKYQLVAEQGTRQMGAAMFDFYRFAHRFFREYIYHEWLHAGQRRVLHRQVGECLEQICGDCMPIAGQLARHFHEADQSVKAAHYALLAARFEQSHYAWAEVERWCQFGLEQAARLPHDQAKQLHLDLLEQSCTGLYGSGQGDVAARRYPEAIRLALQLGANPERIARMCAALADVCDDRDDLAEGLKVVALGKTILAQNNVPLGEAHLELAVIESLLCSSVERPDKALRLATQVLSGADHLAPTASLDQIRAWANYALALALSEQDRHADAIPIYQTAIEIAERVGHEQIVAYGLANLAEALALLGQLDRAEAECSRAIESSLRSGDRGSQAWALYTRGYILDQQDKPRKALRDLQQAVAVAQEIGSRMYAGYAHTALAVLFLAMSDLEAAKYHAQQGLALAGSVPRRKAYALDNAAQVEAAQQHWEQAETYFRQAVALRRRRNCPWAAQTLRHYAAALLQKGETRKAGELLDIALKIFQELELDYESAQTQMLRMKVKP